MLVLVGCVVAGLWFAVDVVRCGWLEQEGCLVGWLVGWLVAWLLCCLVAWLRLWLLLVALVVVAGCGFVGVGWLLGCLVVVGCGCG